MKKSLIQEIRSFLIIRDKYLYGLELNCKNNIFPYKYEDSLLELINASECLSVKSNLSIKTIDEADENLLASLNNVKLNKKLSKNDKAKILMFKKYKIQNSLLIFYPYNMYYKNQTHQSSKQLHKIIKKINYDIKPLLLYRQHFQKKFDTYIVFIYFDNFIILKSENCVLKKIETIPMCKSNTCVILKRYASLI